MRSPGLCVVIISSGGVVVPLTLILAWDVSVPWCSSRYNSPTQRGSHRRRRRASAASAVLLVPLVLAWVGGGGRRVARDDARW